MDCDYADAMSERHWEEIERLHANLTHGLKCDGCGKPASGYGWLASTTTSDPVPGCTKCLQHWACPDCVGDDLGDCEEAGHDGLCESHRDCRSEYEHDAHRESQDPDSPYYQIDGVGFADPGGGSALRAATASNPRNLPCPSCGTPNVLTPADKARGYQCDTCADRAERGWD